VFCSAVAGLLNTSPSKWRAMPAVRLFRMGLSREFLLMSRIGVREEI